MLKWLRSVLKIKKLKGDPITPKVLWKVIQGLQENLKEYFN